MSKRRADACLNSFLKKNNLFFVQNLQINRKNKAQIVVRSSQICAFFLDFEKLTVKIFCMSDYLDANNEELLKDYFSES